MKRLGLLSRLFSTPAPRVAIEIAVDRVSGVLLGKGAKPELAGWANEPLPAGAVVPGVSSRNIVDRKVVIDAIRAVLEGLPKRVSKIGLVVPDMVAKVSMVRFDQTPTKKSDLDQMIRWKVSQAVPFKIENAQLSYTPGAGVGKDFREFVVVLMRRDITKEYEGVCTAAGVQAGIVDLATLNLINGLLVNRRIRRSEDWLMLHAASGYNSIGIIRGEELLFFKTSAAKRSRDVADLVHQTSMYYEDRLEGKGISAVVLDGSEEGEGRPALEFASKHLAERFQVSVLRVAASEFGVRTPETFSSIRTSLAPVGLLMRERRPEN